jgi:hypothetical protein
MVLIMFNLDKLSKMKQAGRQAEHAVLISLLLVRQRHKLLLDMGFLQFICFLQTKNFIALSISMSTQTGL